MPYKQGHWAGRRAQIFPVFPIPLESSGTQEVFFSAQVLIPHTHTQVVRWTRLWLNDQMGKIGCRLTNTIVFSFNTRWYEHTRSLNVCRIRCFCFATQSSVRAHWRVLQMVAPTPPHVILIKLHIFRNAHLTIRLSCRRVSWDADVNVFS